MSPRRLFGAVALLAAALAVAACERATTDESAVRLRPDDGNVLAQGAKVYAAHCAACHGANLQGQPNWRERDAAGRLPAPPHDATGHTWHHPDEVLFNITKLGVAKAANLKDYDTAMPAFDGVLSDAEIIAVLSWIKAQWPPEIRAQQDEVTRAARQARKDPP
jgi:mono/diheme cytochrome c family protein